MPEDTLMGSDTTRGKVGFGPGLSPDKPLEVDIGVGAGQGGQGEGKGEGGMMEGNANQWADQRKNREQFLYDADAEVERWWKEGGEESLKALTRTSNRTSGPPSSLSSSSQSVNSASGPALGFGEPEQAQGEASATSASAKRMNARF